jgi:hypothetical protein
LLALFCQFKLISQFFIRGEEAEDVEENRASEAITVFNTIGRTHYRERIFLSTALLASGAICLSYALGDCPLNLVASNLFCLGPIAAASISGWEKPEI